jgi:4-carboxymuconolactone decarboxylase
MMVDGRRQLREQVEPIVPALIDYTDRVLFGEIWERQDLSKRDRSLVTIAALISTGRWEPLADHLVLGKANGISDAEISEIITHLAFYAGWPSAMTAARVALEASGISKPRGS